MIKWRKDKNSQTLTIKHEKNAQDKRKKWIFEGVRRPVQESDGFIPVGIASGRVTNLFGRCIANSAVDRAERIRTLNQIRPDSSHWKAEIREEKKCAEK
jgi:hypothetical protein